MKEGKTLDEILKTHIFSIPEYQRGYAWKERQLEDLWSDINDIKHIDGKYQYHYMGMLCLASKVLPQQYCWTKRQYFDIVDGQQRLTTIMIILSQLLYSVPKYKCIGEIKSQTLIEEYLYKTSDKSQSRCVFFHYPDNNQNQNYLKKILTNDETIFDGTDDNVYKRNLGYAKKYFKERIDGLSEEEKSDLFDRIISGLLFDYRVVDSSLDVQMVFETMNNRGKPLSTLEKLKNRLIYLQNDNTELCKDINSTWGSIYQHLGKDERLNENRLIADHLSIYRQAKNIIFSESESEDKIFETFSKHPEKYNLGLSEDYKETPCDEKKISGYINGLANFSKHWCSLSVITNENIIRSLYLSSTSEVRIFISIVLLFAEKDKENGVELSNQIFSLLHDILFRNKIPGAFVMDERSLVTRARDLYSTLFENDIVTKNEKINITYNSLLAIRDDFKSQISNHPLALDQFKAFCSASFNYVRGSIGFYRWGDIVKYILVLYEFNLPKNKDNDKISWSKFRQHSIEHILPQDDSNWPGVVTSYKESINALYDVDRAKKAKNILINTIGNLSVIPGGKNSSLGNSSWSIKKEKYATGSLNEQEISQNEKWEYNEILERGKKIINFLMRHLGANLNLTEDDYSTILFHDPSFSIKRQVPHVNNCIST